MNNDLLSAAGLLVTAFAGWFFGKRKNLAEDRAAELDNAVKAVKYYRELLDDMASRLLTALDNIKTMESHNVELRRANTKQAEQLRELMLINQHLIDELQKFKQLK